MKLAFPVLMAVVVLQAGSILADPPTAIVLAPISAETLNRCDSEGLEETLKKRLRRGKRFRLAAADEQAAVRLELLECSHFDQHTKTLGYDHETTTESGGLIVASEQTIELGRESVRTAVLRARLVAGSRFIEVASGPDDHHLGAAVSTIRSAIEKALKDRGRWLLEGQRKAP